MIFVLAGLVMARDIRRKPGSDYFSPLVMGLVPALFWCATVFINLRRPELPEAAEFKAQFQARIVQALASSSADLGLAQEKSQAVAGELASWLI
ncbi:MAG: hypothetical protein V4498_05895, partial [candidate division FCPU426 bacterium]